MPWSIKKQDNKFCVVKDADNEVVKCHETHDQARAHMRALYASEGEGPMTTNQVIVLEAAIQPSEPTGKEWEVTLIGAQRPEDLITVDGRTFIRSANGRLYDAAALEASVAKWDGAKVYDNHLTNEEFERKQGMRSPAKEWLGTIVQPRWDAAKKQLRGVLKVVEDGLRKKLKDAYDLDVLKTVGLSIDAGVIWGPDVHYEGRQFPMIEGFSKILSVDFVSEPAAGGRFERILAANIREKEISMSETENEYAEKISALEEKVSALADALAAKEAEVDEMTDDEVIDAVEDKQLSEAKKARLAEEKRAKEARLEADIARADLYMERALDKAKLPEKFADIVRRQFEGKPATSDEINAAIKTVKEAQVSQDPSGRVRGAGGSDVVIGLGDDERFALEFKRLLMGNTAFKELEHNKHEAVQERMAEDHSYKAWINAGKPELPYYDRISTLLYHYFGGNPLWDGRAMEAATTSSLTTVVKNTVNIMTANDYSQREEWWMPIVTVEEVDSIDQATLARLYGVNTLSVVNEGAAYTELVVADEEETASFVKRGNYIGVTLETLMNDKLGYVRSIPARLADAWYNTQSDLVANVFTVNTAAGPVLADSGALFNNTATSTPGGHANLLATALSYSEFGVVRTAMRKQTDQPLGAGRKLLLRPTHLLVPVDLEQTALEIRNSELVPGQASVTTATTGNFQTANLWRNSFDVIVVPSWTDTDNWAAVSNQVPAIHLIYPRGQRTPQIFSADGETGGAMFTNDELRFKVRLMTYRYSATYDCAPVSDFRPLHKSNV